MKAIKYILGISALLIGLTSCEGLGREKTQDEIEQKWPETITTMAAGDFVLVKRDTLGFTMGDENLVTSSPTHTVKFSKSYYMCKTEVTQAQWKAIMLTNPADNIDAAAGANTDNCPVNNITIEEAKLFVEALNLATGRKFALPTEAQWEWAAIGGIKSNNYTFSGSNNVAEVAAVNGELNEVAKLKANELGLYDMTGNVEEWTANKYGKYSATESTDPVGPTSGSDYVTRGGHYEYGADADLLNVKSRNKIKGTDASYVRGLRLILEEPLPTELLK